MNAGGKAQSFYQSSLRTPADSSASRKDSRDRHLARRILGDPAEPSVRPPAPPHARPLRCRSTVFRCGFCCSHRQLGLPTRRRPGARSAPTIDALRGRGRPRSSRCAGADDWQRRRGQIIAGMQEVMGPLPAEMSPQQHRSAPAAASRSTCRCWIRRSSKGCRGRRFRWLRRRRAAVTAYVWTPKGIVAGEHHAAILALQPTGDLGKAIITGDSNNRGYGLKLRNAGMLSLRPTM